MTRSATSSRTSKKSNSARTAMRQPSSRSATSKAVWDSQTSHSSLRRLRRKYQAHKKERCRDEISAESYCAKSIERRFTHLIRSCVVGQFEGTSSEFNLQVADAKAQAKA